MTAPEAFERYFLETRAKIIDIAANLDRLDRLEGSVESDPRRLQIDEALRIILEDTERRTEKIQMLFSRPYDPQWMDQFPAAKTRR
jgi:hypothetical protein